MAGKNTSANGLHESRKGGIVAPYKLTDQDELYLSEAINRKLSPNDIEVIEQALATFKNLRELHFEGIAKQQDIKRTLAYISKCRSDDSLLALSNCDELTRAEIERAVWLDMRKQGISTAEMIRLAAGIALERLNNAKPVGGAPTKGYQIMFAECCVNLWRHCGGASTVLWRKDESGELSPLLTWSVSLFSALEGTPFDWKKVWTLLSAELKRGKVSTV